MVNGNHQLPDRWEWIELQEACTKIQDGTHFSPKTQYLESAPGRFLYITAKNIKDYGVDLSDVRYVDEEIHRSIYARCNPEQGDLLLTKDGVKTGEITVNQLQEEFSLLSSVALLKPKRDQFIPLFLKYYLSSPFGNQAITGAMTATAIKRIILEKIRLAKVPVASLPELERIVAKIEELFTQLDAGTSALERVQAGLRRYKASVLKAAVEGKLEIQKDKLEIGEDGLPVGWRRVTWKEISPRVTVGYVGKMKDQYTETGIPFLRGQNVREMRFDPAGLLHVSPEFHKRISKSTLNPGDIVVVRSGSVGVSCVIPETLEEANCSDLVIIKKPKDMIPEFGAYYLNSLAKSYVREKQVGVALTHFNTKSVADMPIPLPPLEEQRRIVAEVERRLSVAREVETTVEAALVRASRLRQAVLKSAFEGRL